MRESRVNEILRNQTSIAQKVYEATPIKQPASPSVVYRILSERGVAIDVARVQGCLVSLVDSGLVKRHGTEFQRTPVTHRATERHRPDKEESMPTTSNGTLHRKTEPVTPPASERRGVAHLTDCIERLRELLDELDGAVVEVMEEFEAAGTEAKRLKELRALLKDI